MSLTISLKNIEPSSRRIINTVAAISKNYGLNAFLVGGFIRDLLLNKKSLDLDFTFDSDPSEIAAETAKKLRLNIHKHPDFMTYSLATPAGAEVDFATFRKEDYNSNAALPVVSKGSLLEDLFRRDFSINAMCAVVCPSAKNLHLIDPYGGLEDMKSKTLRVMHPRSFTDDPTRIFRLARFTARFNYKPEMLTLSVLKKSLDAGMLSKLTVTRVKNELNAIFKEAGPKKVFDILKKWKALEQVNPNFKYSYGIKFPGNNKFGHLNYAVLLQRWRLKDAEKLLNDLQLPNSQKREITEILSMLGSGKEPKKSIRVTDFAILKYVGLSKSDYKRIIFPASENRIFVSGSDLVKWGYKPGPKFKKILDFAAEAAGSGRIKNRSQARKLIFDNFRR